MLQKLKQITLSVLLVAAICVPMLYTSASYADGPCAGSDAPYPVDCSTLPAECPGSTQQGPIDPSRNLDCPYNPTTKYTCPAKECTFPKIGPLKQGQTYTPPGGGSQGGTGSGNGNS